MSSMISYFNDRILAPEMMRAMIILYVGPHNRPDFSQDYLLSPILAPDSLLAEFPKTYFLTGERDPLVDDTVIFAGRLRRAKLAKHNAALDRMGRLGGRNLGKEFDDRDVVEVTLIPGISHGFLQFVGVFPEGWKYIFKCAKWIDTIFAAPRSTSNQFLSTPAVTPGGSTFHLHHQRRKTESSGDEDMGLEMSISSDRKGKGKDGYVDEMRRRKEKLLKEQLREKREDLGKARRKVKREKSMISLASEDDLLGRRMLGLAGGLTGIGDDGNADE